EVATADHLDRLAVPVVAAYHREVGAGQRVGRPGHGQAPLVLLDQPALPHRREVQFRVGDVTHVPHTPLVGHVPHEQPQGHIDLVAGDRGTVGDVAGGEHVVDQAGQFSGAEPGHRPAAAAQDLL